MGGVLENAPPGGYFNIHVCNNSETCRGVIRRNGLDLNLSNVLLLDFCPSHSVSITKIMFKPKSVKKCSWHQDTRLQPNLIIMWLYFLVWKIHY